MQTINVKEPRIGIPNNKKLMGILSAHIFIVFHWYFNLYSSSFSQGAVFYVHKLYLSAGMRNSNGLLMVYNQAVVQVSETTIFSFSYVSIIHSQQRYCYSLASRCIVTGYHKSRSKESLSDQGIAFFIFCFSRCVVTYGYSIQRSIGLYVWPKDKVHFNMWVTSFLKVLLSCGRAIVQTF